MALLWVLVFLLGSVAGGVGYRIYWNQTRKPNIQKMARYLKLDPQQTESLKAIFDESVLKYKDLFKQIEPQKTAIRNETRQKIASILRPDQKSLYEEWLKKFRRPEPPGPPPPSSAPTAPPAAPK